MGKSMLQTVLDQRDEIWVETGKCPEQVHLNREEHEQLVRECVDRYGSARELVQIDLIYGMRIRLVLPV